MDAVRRDLIEAPTVGHVFGPAAPSRVYVWEAPIRLYHWMNLLSILVLCATGYLIGQPPAIAIGREPSFSYWFGTVRFLHFAAGFVFFANFLIRIYWGFVGNEYSRWSDTLPLSTERFADQWRDVVRVIKVDVLQLKGERIEPLGHATLALWTYVTTFVMTLFQIATGFALYAAMGPAWIQTAFGWIVPVMGGDMAVRFWHHVAMWFFIVFAMIHVYLVYYHDTAGDRGVVSSMLSGWKFTGRGTREGRS
jgi:Ni/Fe-hydrogenase 1 B-type cytochrome subunit